MNWMRLPRIFSTILIVIALVNGCVWARPIEKTRKHRKAPKLPLGAICSDASGKTSVDLCGADELPGAGDIGAKVNAAIAACSSRCAELNFYGGGRIATGIIVDKPVSLHLSGNFTSTVTGITIYLISSGSRLRGDSQSLTLLFQKNDYMAIGIGPVSNVEVSNMTIQGDCPLRGDRCLTAVEHPPATLANPAEGINSGGSDHVLLANITVRGFRTHGINTGGDSRFWKFYHVTSVSNHDDGVLLAPGSDYAKADFVNSSWNGAIGWDNTGSFNSLSHSFISFNGYEYASTGMDCFGVLIVSLGAGNRDADGNEVTDNDIIGNACQGVIVRAEKSGHHVWHTGISGNRISGAGAANVLSSSHYCIVLDASVPNGGEIKWTGIVNNVCHDFLSDGIVIGGGSGGTQTLNRFERNVSHDNHGYGYVIAAGLGNLLKDNIEYKNGRGGYNIAASTKTSVGSSQP